MKASKLIFAVLSLSTGLIAFSTCAFLLSLIMMLSNGNMFYPELGAGALTGLFYAGIKIWKDGNFHANWKSYAILTFTAWLFFWVASFSKPFRVDFSSAPFSLTVGTGLMVCIAVRCVDLIMKGIRADEINRYQLEIFVIRWIKAFGYLFFVSLIFFPFYTLLVSSFKSQAALLQDPLDYSIDITQNLSGLFNGYIELFQTFNFGGYIYISTIVSITTVFITIVFAVPGAYAVARLNFPGRRILSRSILLIYMIPAIVLVIPLYGIFSMMGLRNNILGLLIVYPATTLPVAVYMLKGYFLSVPAELEEAGMIDGSSRIGVILRITLPLCLPALASVGLYVFMIAWNEFLFAFMFLDDPNTFTISRGVVSLNSSEIPRQYLMAGAVIVTLPVLILFLWFERYLIQGLTAGSVKG